MTIGSRISLIVLILIFLIAVTAQWIAPNDPYAIFTARHAPDGQFLFGPLEPEQLYLVKIFHNNTKLRELEVSTE